MKHRAFLTLASLILAAARMAAAEPTVKIHADFPGGNATVGAVEPGMARVAPDLRTTKTPWFYWDFAAESSGPGEVTFVLPAGKVGTRGPAISEDGGATWRWLGADAVRYAPPKAADAPQEDRFSYTFSAAGQEVRFAVGFPYVQADLDAFLKAQAGNPNLKTSVLATTLGGRPVELLQIGNPGPGITPVLAAARSHACEALASYVLEGFLEEAMSATPIGEEFRKKYVLFAAPILDKDGVQNGDQGKNRDPHDHNRDYGPTNLYPEIKALQELGAREKVKIAIDFHCPALRGDIHEAFHWLGLKIPHISTNANELSDWVGQERPGMANKPLNFLSEPKSPPQIENIPFSWYFAAQNDPLLAITLESPYAQLESTDMARAYGRAVLRGLVRSEFVASGSPNPREGGGYPAFEAFQKTFTQLANSSPAEAEKLAAKVLSDPASPAAYRAQANLGLAALRLREKRFADALGCAQAVKTDPAATNAQLAAAASAILNIQIGNPDATAETVTAALAALEALPYLAPSVRAAAYTELSAHYEAKGDLPQALEFAKKRIAVSDDHKKTAAMLRTAEVLDRMGRRDDAVAVRKEVVGILRPVLLPAPNGRSIFLGINTGEYFDALNGIPTSTLAERMEAAQIILNYPTLPSGLRERTQIWVEENTPKTGAS